MSKLTTSGLMFRGHPVCFFEEIPEPPTPTLPAYTIRLKFTEGVTPTFSKGTGVQVSSSPNIWDLTYENADWTRLLETQTYLIEVLGANIAGVTKLDYSFRTCSNLASISIFDTSTVISTYRMFQGCSSLTTVPLFDTSSMTNMNSMFFNCTALTAVPLFNTSNVTNMNGMFRGCINVQSGALALYQQASSQATVPTHTSTFYNCGSNTVTGAAELAQIPSDWGGTGS